MLTALADGIGIPLSDLFVLAEELDRGDAGGRVVFAGTPPLRLRRMTISSLYPHKGVPLPEPAALMGMLGLIVAVSRMRFPHAL